MRIRAFSFYIALFILFAAGCTSKKEEGADQLLIGEESFQKEIAGKKVELVTLDNQKGMIVQITNYGGKVVSIICPDRSGNPKDVCLGYESLDEYVNGAASLGATMGPYANRIANATFELDGTVYTLDKNNGEHTIHGGSAAFRSRVWDIDAIEEDKLTLSILSEDGAGGFPGNLRLTVTYTVTEINELVIHYQATTDKRTVFNFTNHAFFNLAGEGSGNVLGHQLLVYSDSITPVDATGIPTGEIIPVEGTPFDFRTMKSLGRDIEEDNIQLKYMGGYDHNYVLNTKSAIPTHVATLKSSETGIVMEVLTTEPGLQVYTANTLSTVGKGGKHYGSYSSVCLETQHFPDSPHHANFPSCVLDPGTDYRSTTIYKFGVEK